MIEPTELSQPRTRDFFFRGTRRMFRVHFVSKQLLLSSSSWSFLGQQKRRVVRRSFERRRGRGSHSTIHEMFSSNQLFSYVTCTIKFFEDQKKQLFSSISWSFLGQQKRHVFCHSFKVDGVVVHIVQSTKFFFKPIIFLYNFYCQGFLRT